MNGMNGMDGINGMDGADGAPGPMGPAGADGASGANILGVENTFTANNYFTETITFSKQLVLPESLTEVSITNYNELNIDCAHASSGIFILNINYLPSPTIIRNLTILNPRIGGQYVVYIHNYTYLSFSINGRTTYPPLYVNMSSSTGSSSSSSSNVGKMNYPGAVMITGNTELSSGILSFTWDGMYAFVACSAYGISSIMGES
jgi:hypothetical protein